MIDGNVNTWERFKKSLKGKKGYTAKKVSRKDELGETWDIYQTIRDGMVVAEIREDRV